MVGRLTFALGGLIACPGAAASYVVCSRVITESNQLFIEVPRHPTSRRPQGTPLLEHVREHLPAFLHEREASDSKPVWFVQCEFERYLRCGDKRFGHATLACTRCGFEHDIAFSCKRRGFCTYCLHLRMIEQSTFIQTHVIGDTPVRHWVLSLPSPLSNLLGFDGPLTSKVLAAWTAAISRHYLVQARKVTNADEVLILGVGVVTGIHRASSMLYACLHFHSAVTNGVFVLNRDSGVVSFVDLPAPTPAEISDVAWDTCKRAVRMFRRRKMWTDLAGAPGDPDRLVSGEIDLRSRKRPVRFNASASRRHVVVPESPGVGTFDVWVGQHIRRGQSGRLGRLLRYIFAPPVRDHQLVREPDGCITLELDRSRHDGTGKRTFTPTQLIEALIGLIPQPQFRLIRLHGMYARRAKYRDQIVAQPPAPEVGPEEKTERDEPSEDRRAWAELLRHAYEVEVLRCRCTGRFLLITLESDRLSYRREMDRRHRGRAPPGNRFEHIAE